VEGLSAAKRSCLIRDIAERHNVDVICFQETHVDVDCASVFISTREIKNNRFFHITNFVMPAFSDNQSKLIVHTWVLCVSISI